MALVRPVLKFFRIPANRFPSMMEQLLFEERLFRETRDNWCIVGYGPAPVPNIVVGLSGKPDQLLNLDLCKKDGITAVRRFTGGGTVVVDSSTVFVSFVCEKKVLPRKVAHSPPALMKWSASFYDDVFRRCQNWPERVSQDDTVDAAHKFGLQEHDYCFGKRKFGGNAESISKDRWVHHTSFLWDFDDRAMEYLTLPNKRPAYREDRPHLDFLCRLQEYVPTASEAEPAPAFGDTDGQPPEPAFWHPSDHFVQAVADSASAIFDVQHVLFEEVEEILAQSKPVSLRSRPINLDEYSND